jgi:hypothetical protein
VLGPNYSMELFAPSLFLMSILLGEYLAGR